MNIEAQLLKIIEDQQQQLKQQQQAQEEALQLIQAQSQTIAQLKSFMRTLDEKHNEAVQIVQEYQKITQRLAAQTISETFLQTVQDNLQTQLQARLNDLLKNLQIENLIQGYIKQELPSLVQIEIEKQTGQLAKQMKEKFDSVSSYHEKFQDLIQTLSSKL